MTIAKALIYCRVSSKAQETDGHGLASQETRCRQHATSKGYEVAAVFPDTITGGGDFMKRPGMVALLSFIDAQPGEEFVVIFDDLKRASRDTRAFLDLRDAFRARGVKAECLNFKLGDSPEDEFIETIIAAQGKLERTQHARQVSQKMRARMQNGYWVHNAPVGYRYAKKKNYGKVLVPDAPFDGIVREAFEGYASGRFQSQAEVKRFLEGFPEFPFLKKGVLKQQQVTRLLTQPVYAGYIHSDFYGISWLKAQHDPLISLEVFDKVQERRSGIAKAPKRKNIGETFALRGIVTCACCDVPLRSSITKGNGGHYPYYLCQTRGCDHYGKSMKRDQVERDVGELVKTLQPTEGLLMLAKAMFHHIWTVRQDQAQDVLRAGKRKIAVIDQDIDKLLDTITTVKTASVIQRCEEKVDSLEHEKATLTEKLANQAKPQATFEEKLEPVLTFLANPWKLWETGNITLRRTILKLAFADRNSIRSFCGC